MKYTDGPVSPMVDVETERLAKKQKQILTQALKGVRNYCKMLSECQIDIDKVSVNVLNPFLYQHSPEDEPISIDFEKWCKSEFTTNDAEFDYEIYMMCSQIDAADNPNSRLITGEEDNTPVKASTPLMIQNTASVDIKEKESIGELSDFEDEINNMINGLTI